MGAASGCAVNPSVRRARSRAGVVVAVLAVIGSFVLAANTKTSGAAYSDRALSSDNEIQAGFWARLVVGGDVASCGLRVDGSVWCWGDNAEGQLGDGSTSDSSVAVRVVGVGGSGTLSGVVEVVSGAKSKHVCALGDDASVVCWGQGDRGQLGDGSTSDSSSPVVFDDASGAPLTDAVSVAAGLEHTCVARSDGSVWCVGRNDKGQLGDGTTSDSTVLRQVVGVGGSGTLSGVVEVASGEKHTCAVRDDASVVCWGQGDKGQLGNGATSDSSSPVMVSTSSGTLSGAVSVAAGKKFSCAVTSGTEVWCWGENNEGQVGDGTTTDRSLAVRVITTDSSALTGVVAADGGEQHTCARTSSDAVWCWGRNDKGQLGDGTTTDHETAAQVGSLTNIVDIGTGSKHTCAVEHDGTTWCWGQNADGQLGDATTTDHTTPSRVMRG